MSKTIAIFTDGTGNSAGKLFKTNVWRVYQALDLTPLTAQRIAQGELQQVAYYQDGVGTSSFRPLAILGGVFGVGLKRNVIEAYCELCRHYEPDDRIFFFGFSRGAFTSRILNGFVVNQGLLRCGTDDELVRYAHDAYRAYRRCFNQTMGLVGPLRNLRDWIIRRWRQLHHQHPYAEIEKVHPAKVAFIGVWDTVSAYGLPIDALARGIDDYVWPLSMPNYVLSSRVERACHALSLDDERNTFHPLLWDELHSENPERLQQVWFAGMHSDIGGGYPDDGLAQIPLLWMMREAQAAGLRFKRGAIAEVERAINQSAPMHDSRRGTGGYYRYQPRDISAFVNPPSPTTLSTRDPDLEGLGLLRRVRIHHSVFDRIRFGPDRYAPIVLPDEFDVVDPNGTVLPSLINNRAAFIAGRAQVWDSVWRKQVVYLLTVAASLLLAALPLRNQPPAACEGPQCILSPIIDTVGGFLPSFLRFWTDGFARNPGLFVIGVVVIAALLAESARLQQLIHDQMHAVWGQALAAGQPSAAVGVQPENWVRRLRTSPRYQGFWQFVRWRFVPTIFGPAVLAAGAILAVGAGLLVGYRVELVLAERSSRFCTASPQPPRLVQGAETAQGEFATSSPCWPTGLAVEEKARYLLTLKTAQPWADDDGLIPTNPSGFDAAEFRSLFARLGAWPLARSLTARWFEPFVKIVPADAASYSQALEMHDSGNGTWTAEFTAKKSGGLFLYVNDAIISWNGLEPDYYKNNRGTALVTVQKM